MESVLLEYGYHRFSTNLAEFDVFFDVYGAVVNVVQVIDLHQELCFIKEQYFYIKRQIYEMIAKKGYLDVHIFTLILADNPIGAASITEDDKMSWIISKKENKCMILEGHIKDFYGISVLVERALDKNYKIPDKKNVEEGEETGSNANNRFPLSYIIKEFNLSTISPMNICIIFMNIFIFLILEFKGSTEDIQFMIGHGALYIPAILHEKEYIRFFTSIFLHFGIEHLFFNMLILMVIGSNVERELGKIRYVLLYMLSGIAGNIISFLFALFFHPQSVSAGASGAIFGIIGSLLYIFLANRGKIEDRAIVRMLMLIAYSLASGFTSRGIDNAAHVGGLVSGFALAMLFYPRNQFLKKEK